MNKSMNSLLAIALFFLNFKSKKSEQALFTSDL